MTFPNSRPVLGIDLGGSNLRALLLDARGDEIADLAEPTSGPDAAAVVAQLGALARRLADGAGVEWSDVAGVGVGVPGVVVDGVLHMAPNLPPFGDVDLASALRLELGADVVVENDVNMATLGEHRHGLGEGVDDFVFIAVGTGVGMGVVSGGRLLHGARGAAGELGGLPLGDGRTLEDVAGGLGVAARYGERSGRRGLTAVDVYDAAAADDRAAGEVLDEQVAVIGRAVAAVHAILDPALVVFGGGIGSREDFLDRVREYVGRLGAHVAIERSALGERAGLVGAAEAAREQTALRERVDA